MLLLLEFNFSCGTHLDHGDAAGELGETLLELLLVIVGCGLFNLSLDLRHARLDLSWLARAIHDGGVVL